MARLHEYQGKAILARAGLNVPRGVVVKTPDEAVQAVASLGCPCVIKIQAWTTGRASIGGVAFAETPEQAAAHAHRMLQIRVGQFPVTELLVEEKLAIRREVFVAMTIDDRRRQPVMLIGSAGGTGIEDRSAAVRRVPCPIDSGPTVDAIKAALGHDSTSGLVEAIQSIFQAAKSVEARSLEVNPLVVTAAERIVAADCRITVDDYAVFRHPELGIEIARELDHPPTALEKTAYAVDQADPRGTFYFVQMATQAAEGSKGLVGFHGAGGGGSMMAMDAVQSEGFTVANFTDTSGNPSAGKVYRAARIILAQPGIVGYFGSGSGVASQEQFWSAYGLAKAFWELEISIPVVIRLGGNTEDRAVEILQSVSRDVPATIEGYRKSDPPAKIAARFASLVAEAQPVNWMPRKPRRPAFVRHPSAPSLPIRGGRVWIDSNADPAPIAARSLGLLNVTAGRLTPAGDLTTKDSELIACEVECRRDNIHGIYVELDIPGWDD